MSFQIFIWSTKYFGIYVWLDILEDFIQSIYSTCDSSMDIFSLLLDGDGCCLQLTTSVESILPKMEIEKRVSTVRNDEMDFCVDGFQVIAEISLRQAKWRLDIIDLRKREPAVGSNGRIAWEKDVEWYLGYALVFT